jgi:hypothetical protein
LLLFGLAFAVPAFGQSAPPSDAGATQSPPAQQTPPQPPVRDILGDLNAEQVKAGEFPGAILIPNTGGVSLGIIGFAKGLAIYDSKAEGREAIFAPSTLGALGRDDLDGGTTLSAEMSTVAFDARAPLASGRVRAYVHFDFQRGGFNLREAYLTWSGHWGEILAGRNWTTIFDMQTIGEGVSEPVLAGALLTQQAMFRYKQTFGPRITVQLAAEDPSSSDVTAPTTVVTRTAWPDAIGTIAYGTAAAHLQIGGIVRQLEYDPNDGPGASDTGGGIQISGHFQKGRERVTGGFVTGNGLGRYLIGLTATDGAFVGIDPPQLVTRTNRGGYVAFRHRWNDRYRSWFAWGKASTETIEQQGPNALANSSIFLANVFYKANRFTTVGLEYEYGRRENRDGSVLDNQRVMLGIQVF